MTVFLRSLGNHHTVSGRAVMVEFAQGTADAESRGRPCAGGRMSEVALLTACLVGAADIFLPKMTSLISKLFGLKV